jgi:hypothetical protein
MRGLFRALPAAGGGQQHGLATEITVRARARLPD